MFLVLVTTFSGLFAQNQQDDTFTEEFFLKIDNDAFLAQTVDRYYSSGIFSISENLHRRAPSLSD